MEWRASEWNGHTQWSLYDGEMELGRIHWYEPRTCWIWMLFDRDNIDAMIEGQEPTAALAAYALMKEIRAPSHPITLVNARR